MATNAAPKAATKYEDKGERNDGENENKSEIADVWNKVNKIK